MKKVSLLLLIVVALFVTGCTTTVQTLPGKDLPLARASYTVLGETTATVSGAVILRFIPLADPFTSKIGIIGAANPASYLDPLSSFKNSVIYKALQQMPEADAVIEPSFTVEALDYLIFTSYKITVKARGIKYIVGTNSK